MTIFSDMPVQTNTQVAGYRHVKKMRNHNLVSAYTALAPMIYQRLE